MAVGEVSDVRSLKRRLSRLHGLPPRFRQRLLCDGTALEDAEELDSPLDLQLVLLPFADASHPQVYKLATAAQNGASAEAGISKHHPPPPLQLSPPSPPYRHRQQ